jgi:hypothetical protein
LLAADAGSSAAPPAITMLTSVTPASKTRLQFSSRILMPKKRQRQALVPGGRGTQNAARQNHGNMEQRLNVHFVTQRRNDSRAATYRLQDL